MAELEEVEPPVPLVLLPCTSCNRTFRPEVLAKHSKVCEKSLMKKRKKFDSAKQRLQGTDVPVFPPPPKSKESPLKPLQQTKWREKQVEITKSLNSGRKKSEQTSSFPVKPSDHERCPYCDRHFGPKAFDRHTEWCKEQHIKLKNNNNVNIEARERLQVRTKYRAPLSNRVLTRDKYQPRSRDPSPMSASRIEADDPMKQKLPSPLNRTSSLRLSSRSKSMIAKSPSVPKIELKEGIMRKNQSSITVRQQDVTLNDVEKHLRSHDRGVTQPKILSGNQNQKKHLPHVVRHVIATVLPKRFSIQDVVKYDPFASAEQQMLELFGGASQKPQQAEKTSPPVTANNNTAPIKPESSSPQTTSPTSAFAVFTPKSKRSPSQESLKLDNKENNNFDSDNTPSPPPNEQMNNNHKNFSLSNLSLCSIISIDSIDCNRNPINVKTFKSREEPLQRSLSASEGKSSRNRVKVNMQQMLYGFDSPEVPLPNSKSADVGNLEACEAELIVSMMEFEKMLNSSPLPNLEPPPSPSSPPSKPEDISFSPKRDNDLRQDSKSAVPFSIDSAYGSLTRASGDGDVVNVEPSKFCHECGAKYPVAMAKFCCNCGIRRLTM